MTSPAWSVKFSPDGKYLAVGRYQWVQLWEVQTGSLVREFEPHADAVRCLAFSNDGTRLFAGGGLPGRGGEVKIWDVTSGDLVDAFDLHGDTIESIALTPDNASMVTASMDEFLHIAAVADGEIQQTLTQHVGRVLAVAYRDDGKYFATGSEDKTVKVWDSATKSVIVNFDQNDEAVFAVAFAPEENMLVSGSADNAVRSWRLIETQNESGSLEVRGALVRIYNGHQEPVYAVDCGASGTDAIIVSGGADATVIVWDLRSGNQIATFSEPEDVIYAVDLSPDGRFVAASSRDGCTRVWNISDRQLVAEFCDTE